MSQYVLEPRRTSIAFHICLGTKSRQKFSPIQYIRKKGINVVFSPTAPTERLAIHYFLTSAMSHQIVLVHYSISIDTADLHLGVPEFECQPGH
jgi:hypothetical protein